MSGRRGAWRQRGTETRQRTGMCCFLEQMFWTSPWAAGSSPSSQVSVAMSRGPSRVTTTATQQQQGHISHRLSRAQSKCTGDRLGVTDMPPACRTHHSPQLTPVGRAPTLHLLEYVSWPVSPSHWPSLDPLAFWLFYRLTLLPFTPGPCCIPPPLSASPPPRTLCPARPRQLVPSPCPLPCHPYLIQISSLALSTHYVINFFHTVNQIPQSYVS